MLPQSFGTFESREGNLTLHNQRAGSVSNVEVRYAVDDVVLRTVAKIAFTYLAWVSENRVPGFVRGGEQLLPSANASALRNDFPLTRVQSGQSRCQSIPLFYGQARRQTKDSGEEVVREVVREPRLLLRQQR